jgi:hypothetical protein
MCLVHHQPFPDPPAAAAHRRGWCWEQSEVVGLVAGGATGYVPTLIQEGVLLNVSACREGAGLLLRQGPLWRRGQMPAGWRAELAAFRAPPATGPPSRAG